MREEGAGAVVGDGVDNGLGVGAGEGGEGGGGAGWVLVGRRVSEGDNGEVCGGGDSVRSFDGGVEAYHFGGGEDVGRGY